MMRRNEVSTRSGPGSPSGQPAWGGGCDRIAIFAMVETGETITRSLPLAVLTPLSRRKINEP